MNINWGFIKPAADGGFFLGHRTTNSELGQVRYSIYITQHGNSKIVLDTIADFFKAVLYVKNLLVIMCINIQ